MDSKHNLIKVLIICYVPELARNNSMNIIANTIKTTLEMSATKNGKIIDVCDIITESNNMRTINRLKEVADYLNQANRKAIVYYYGHGDQVVDRNRDDDDGKDEKWMTQNILDDQISEIFNKIHNTSRLYLFSDSCSSGSMIDKKLNNRPWISISSANDRQDAMATSEGGAFTMWGLLPGFKALANPTPKDLHNFIKNNLFFDTQTSILNTGIDRLIFEKIF